MVPFSKALCPRQAYLASIVPGGFGGLEGLTQQAPGESFLHYLFVAFAIVWLVFFGYLFYLARRQADLHRDMEQLRRSSLRGEPTPSQGTSTRRE